MGSDDGIGAGGEAAGCAGDAARGAGTGCALGLASCSNGSMSDSPMTQQMASHSKTWEATAYIQHAAGRLERIRWPGLGRTGGVGCGSACRPLPCIF